MHPGPSRKCSGCKVTNWSDWRTFLDLEGGPTSPVFDLEDENTLGTRRVDQTRRAPRRPAESNGLTPNLARRRSITKHTVYFPN